MLTGAHVLIFSTNATADAAFLRDELALPHVDAGGGFLIFGLPPAELAMHEAVGTSAGKHELYLICEDIKAFVAKLTEKSIACDPIAERGWGSASSITLPSGLKLGGLRVRTTAARPAAKKKVAKARCRATAKAVRKAVKKVAKVTKKAAAKPRKKKKK